MVGFNEQPITTRRIAITKIRFLFELADGKPTTSTTQPIRASESAIEASSQPCKVVFILEASQNAARSIGEKDGSKNYQITVQYFFFLISSTFKNAEKAKIN